MDVWDGDETAFSEKDWHCYFFAAEAAHPMAAVRRMPIPNIRWQSVFQRLQTNIKLKIMLIAVRYGNGWQEKKTPLPVFSKRYSCNVI
ncbi:hypothetical protein JW933_01070, partial [candidate division FCPU426 bacterium]|nr:hypothetical protein [candidate division FCPU426 bacterium]